MQWSGLWAMPADQEGARRRLRRAAVPRRTARAAGPRCRSARTARRSAPAASTIDAAKAYVKWLWVDRTDYQEDFALSYGFHIPARISLAKKAAKLQVGRGGRRGALHHRLRLRATRCCGRRRLPAPRCQDALSRIIKDGADPAAQVKAVVADGDGRAQARDDEEELTRRADAGCSGPQNRYLWFWIFIGPFVIGLAVFTYVPLAVERLPQLLRRPQHGHPDALRGLRQLRVDAAGPGVHAPAWGRSRLLAVHRARRRTRCRWGSR